MHRWSWLCAVGLIGCAELPVVRPIEPGVEVVRLDAEAVDCVPLERVEVRSGQAAAPTSEALRSYAEAHGASVVIVDGFRVEEQAHDSVVVLKAQLLTCGRRGQRSPNASTSVSAPMVCAHEANTSPAVQSRLR